jgi:tRNA-splicing ligase RtcB
MITKENLKKISNYLWEIPPSFRPDMRVPARIYATEKMLEQIFKDRSLWQLVNVATLPGILKYSLAMPDIHEGYGFPIGGVAAFDAKNGVISPGGVGYDINCLHPDARVLIQHNTWLTIKQMEKKWKEVELRHVNFKEKSLKNSSLKYFLKRKEKNYLYEIATKAGYKLKVTGDHPIYTPDGMKETKKLKIKEKIAVFPFQGTKYEEPQKKVIINETDIKKSLSKFNKTIKGNAFEQILMFLKKRNLLPLKYNSPQLPFLLKIMGYVLGDGSISFIGKKKKGVVWFYGKSEDLETIRQDLIEIGFSPSRIYQRKRHHKISTHYKKYQFSRIEYSFKVQSTGFAILLHALGLPVGLKTCQKYEIPQWIFNAPLWQQRLFLAAFFGAELSCPSVFGKYNFYNLQLNMSKAVTLKENAYKFLTQIQKLLKNFGVKCAPIVEVNGYKYEGKRGQTTGLRLQILSNTENLLKFLETVGYEYNHKKQQEACYVCHYLRLKEKIVKQRTEIRILARQMHAQGEPLAVIYKTLDNYPSAPKQFIEHSLWTFRGEPRVAFDFPSYEECKREFVLGNNGLVWDEIEDIKKIPYKGWVYDVTINNDNHNFIANNFVVSNCGVRILTSHFSHSELAPHILDLTNQINRDVPSGVGRGGRIVLDDKAMTRVLEGGAKHLVSQGYGVQEDLEHAEEGGCLAGADASLVSNQAKSRGRDQLGTLGSGNHFLEIQRVEKIFLPEIAKAFGLFENQITVMIHTGSRGLGHQVCTDYVRIMNAKIPEWGIKLPDRELACAPLNSREGQNYFKAMAAAANFAWANRQMITHIVRKAWEKVLIGKGVSGNYELKLVYDVAHNIAKFEEHEINGKKIKVCMHRKGATRAFGPGRPELPKVYREIGQPVLIPGSMGTASYILVGTGQAMVESFGSTCHGSGRQMSRAEAKRRVSGAELKKEFEKMGIILRCPSISGLIEEAPVAYKDIDEIVEVVDRAGLAKRVAKLRPLAVVKGG